MAEIRELVLTFLERLSHNALPKNRKRETLDACISIEIFPCLKRDRDIGRKAVLSDAKTAFACTVADPDLELRAGGGGGGGPPLDPPLVYPHFKVLLDGERVSMR